MKRTILLDNRWLKLFEDKYQLDNGTPCTYYHVERSDAVMAIAVEIDAGDAYTYIVNQHRHPVQTTLWQFPLGGLDAHADTEQRASTELREETGVTAGSMLHVGSFYTDPGFSSQKMHVCIGSDIQAVQNQKLEDTEFGLIAKRVPLQDLDNFLEINQMQDAWSICGIYFLRLFLESQRLSGN